MVNVGSTRQSTASVDTVASSAPAPSALKTTTLCRSAPSSTASPRMPLQVIITAANTVSRGSEAASGPPDTMSVTISATSITVTATASTSDPNGSPTRCATTSAWCTAASTAPTSTTATSSAGTVGSDRPQLTASTSRATTGTTVVQARRGCRVVVTMGQRWHIVELSLRSWPRLRHGDAEGVRVAVTRGAGGHPADGPGPRPVVDAVGVVARALQLQGRALQCAGAGHHVDRHGLVLLGEVLRLQRRAGGQCAPAAVGARVERLDEHAVAVGHRQVESQVRRRPGPLR